MVTKNRFSVGDYNKLVVRKIGPMKIVEKTNPSAYNFTSWKLTTHVRTSYIFNVNHLILYHEDSSEDKPLNSGQILLNLGRMM